MSKEMWVKVSDAANELCTYPKKIYRLGDDGKLEIRSVDGSTRLFEVSRVSLDQYKKDNPIEKNPLKLVRSEMFKIHSICDSIASDTQEMMSVANISEHRVGFLLEHIDVIEESLVSVRKNLTSTKVSQLGLAA